MPGKPSRGVNRSVDADENPWPAAAPPTGS